MRGAVALTAPWVRGPALMAREPLALAAAVARIDVDPAFPPPTLLVLPLAGSAVAALALASATLALGWWTTHRAERVHPAVVLRS